MNDRALRLNVGWALAGNCGWAVCQWAVLIAVAKLGTADDVGQFALALAMTAPPMILANLHLRAVQATDARELHAFGACLGLRLLTTLAAIVAILLVATAGGMTGQRLALVTAVAVSKAADAISDVLYGRLQRDEALRPIALSMLLRGLGGVIAITAVMASGGSLVSATAALAVVSLACLAGFDAVNVRRLTSLRPDFRFVALRPLAWLALPMGCVMALGSLTANVPRYAIEAHLGTVALGHFAALAYLFVAAMQPMLALGAAVSPRLAQLYVRDLQAYRQLVRRTVQGALALGLVTVTATMAAGGSVLRLAYAPEYAAHTVAFEWAAVATAVGFVSSALGTAVTAARRFHAQLASALLALGTCAVASAVLVPRYELVGAAWAMGCTEAVRALCAAAVYADAVARRSGTTATIHGAEVASVG